MAGATYAVTNAVSVYAGYSQANRAPTLLELDCASQTQPCLLEGSLVADPQLKQVVSHTYEAGLRGGSDWNGGRVSWNASLFRTDSDNDIVALASAIRLSISSRRKSSSTSSPQLRTSWRSRWRRR